MHIGLKSKGSKVQVRLPNSELLYVLAEDQRGK